MKQPQHKQTNNRIQINLSTQILQLGKSFIQEKGNFIEDFNG